VHWGDRSQLLDVSTRPVATAAALQRLQVVVNLTYRLLVCSECSCVVGASGLALATHAKANHQGRPTVRNDVEVIEALAAELGLAERVGAAVLPRGSIAVQGLAVHWRPLCPVCKKYDTNSWRRRQQLVGGHPFQVVVLAYP
jgi:hypothetical protein